MAQSSRNRTGVAHCGCVRIDCCNTRLESLLVTFSLKCLQWLNDWLIELVAYNARQNIKKYETYFSSHNGLKKKFSGKAFYRVDSESPSIPMACCKTYPYLKVNNLSLDFLYSLREFWRRMLSNFKDVKLFSSSASDRLSSAEDRKEPSLFVLRVLHLFTRHELKKF